MVTEISPCYIHFNVTELWHGCKATIRRHKIPRCTKLLRYFQLVTSPLVLLHYCFTMKNLFQTNVEDDIIAP